MGNQVTRLISTITRQNVALNPVSAPEEQIIDIPAYAPGLGPQLGRLPDELLHMIFKMVATSMFAEHSRFHECIDPKLFGILNCYASVNKIRNVSTDFTGFFMEAMYENYHFAFKAAIPKVIGYGTRIPPPLPLPHFRRHLRSMRIELVLENSYIVPSSWYSPRRRNITTFNQLMVFCPSAWFLLHLTHPDIGFGSLRLLEIVICTEFKHELDDDFLGVLQNANFSFNAGEVKLTVVNIHGWTGRDEEKVARSILGTE